MKLTIDSTGTGLHVTQDVSQQVKRARAANPQYGHALAALKDDLVGGIADDAGPFAVHVELTIERTSPDAAPAPVVAETPAKEPVKSPTITRATDT